MAAITFPTSPTNGQVYVAPNGFSYTWDGTMSIWMASSAGGGGGGPTTGVITGSAAQDYQKGATTPTLRADGVAALVEGDMWYDTTNDSLKVYDGALWDAPASPTTGVITGTAAYDYQVAALAPTVRSGGGALVDGDLWFDTTANVFKTRKTGAWVSPAVAPTTGVITGTAAQDYQKGTATPTLRADGVASLVEGDLWYDTTNDSLKVYDGAAWDAPASPTTGVITGTAAQDYQKGTATPTLRADGVAALVEGDMWYDTATDSLKVWNGTIWKSAVVSTLPNYGITIGSVSTSLSGTYTVPSSGVSKIIVQMHGATGSIGSFTARMGGAGGAGYAEKLINVTPGQSFPYVLGGPGQTSTFDTISITSGGAPATFTGGSGGVATGGDFNANGGNGGNGFNAASSYGGGGGAGSRAGPGGAGGNATSGVPGAGGGTGGLNASGSTPGAGATSEAAGTVSLPWITETTRSFPSGETVANLSTGAKSTMSTRVNTTGGTIFKYPSGPVSVNSFSAAAGDSSYVGWPGQMVIYEF